MRKYIINLSKPYCILLFIIVNCSLLAQSEAPNIQHLDALQDWVSNHARDYDTATFVFKYAHLALKKSQTTQSPSKIALANENLATWHSYNYGTFEIDSATHYGLKALEQYKIVGDEVNIGKIYNYLAIDYTANYQHKEAEAATFKAIAIFEKYNNHSALADAFLNLSSIYIDTKDTLKAVEYANKSIHLAISTPLTEDLPYLYLGTMHAHLLNEDYHKVFEQSNEAIQLFNTQGIEGNEVLKAHNRRGDAYLATGQYDKALKDYQFAYEGAMKLYGQEHANGYADNLGRVYFQKKLYRKALSYFLAGIQYADAFKVAYLLDKRHQELTNCYEKLGDFKNAYYHSIQADSIEKAILHNKMERQQNALLVKYETAKKDATISHQTTLITQQQAIQYLTYGILGMCTLLIGGLWWAFRKNRNKNEQLHVLNTDLIVKNNQNELLLKEIHHRVKNNLELVKSLLSLQSAQIDNPEIQAAIQASESRVLSMGIIHQKLYQGKNLAAIEMKDYFLHLGEGILATFDADDRIKIECIMEELELDVDTAVPIGLIVNELLTNALKYAFPAGQQGKIEILLKTDKEFIQLSVRDNGIGKIANLAAKGTGFGTQLINLLTLQLNGNMEEKIENGTIISFRFKKQMAA